MKYSCLFILLVWGALSTLYYSLAQRTALESMWWIPVLLGLSAAIVVANIQGLLIALKQLRASKKNPRGWRDGELIAVSGRIQANKQPLEAPFSGRKAVIVDYRLQGASHTDTDNSAMSDFQGMLMVPCTIHARNSQLKVVGFPILAQIKEQRFDDDQDIRRAAKFLAKTSFKPKPASILGMLRDLNQVLSDPDGEVSEHLKEAKVYLPQLELEQGQQATLEQTKAYEDQLYDFVLSRGYGLQETVVEHGAEVTAFGSYRSKIQSIDIGGGLKQLSHQLHLGPISKVIGKQFRSSIIALVFWGAVAIAAHWYFGHQIGLIPQAPFSFSGS